MENWYSTTLGDQIYQHEQLQVDRVLSHLFGYYLIQLTDGCLVSDTSKTPISRVFTLGTGGARCNPLHLQGHIDALPFASNSLDLVVIPHTLESVERPELVLQEVYRCLIPDGRLIVLGFNPWSFWGLAKLFKRGQSNLFPWDRRFISVSRLQQWLIGHGCEIIESDTYYFRPPFSSEKLLEASIFLEMVGQLCWPYFGAFYMIVAQKKLSTLTPFGERARWRRLIRLGGQAAKLT